jgi:hypothetical protein
MTVPGPRGFDAFADAIAARLENGARAYGGRSFVRHSSELVREILEELESIAGWSFILWTRLRGVRDVLSFAESRGTRGR